MQKRKFGVTLLAGLLVALGVGQVAVAGVITPNPGLPPDTGAYLTAQQVHALYPTGVYPEVILENILHSGFFDVLITPLPGGDELEEFQSTLQGNATVGGIPVGPISLQGPVQVITQGKTGNTTGTFQTEMISMSLSGNVGGFPVQVRESPAQPSTGQTTITDIGGGLFQIDSFFDVFTEISIDQGAGFGPFVPAQGSVRVDLGIPGSIIPEPSTFALAALGVLSLGMIGWRRRRR